MLAVGTVTLPDGRLCLAVERGNYEDDTNAWVPDGRGATVTVSATGDDLTPEELNTVLTLGDQTWCLHEWISAHTKWQMEYEED